MTDPQPTEHRLSGRAKLAVDMGPLIVFMVAYFFGGKLMSIAGGMVGQEWCLRTGAEMYLAVALFMPTFAIAFAYSTWKEKRIAPMLLVSGVMIGVLGTLTLVLQNKTFFYMKPTIVYVLFAGLLYWGMATGKNFMRTVFDGALTMPDHAWRTLTIRYSIFFASLAILNEVAWRWLTKDCPPEPEIAQNAGQWGWLLAECGLEEVAKCEGEGNWVKLKAFGFTIISLIFTGAQAPLIAKYMQDDEPKAS